MGEFVGGKSGSSFAKFVVKIVCRIFFLGGGLMGIFIIGGGIIWGSTPWGRAIIGQNEES